MRPTLIQQRKRNKKSSLFIEKGSFFAPESIFFSFREEKRVLFFAERKERKEAASVPLDRWCKPIAHHVGSRHVFVLTSSHNPRRNTPHGQRVQSGSLRLRAQASQPYLLSARRMLACRAKREQTTVGSRVYTLSSRRLRVRDGSLGDSFRRFLVGEKTTSLFSFEKEKRVLFLCAQEKNEKKPQAYRLTVCATGSGSVAAMKDGVHARGARVIRQPPPLL